MNNINNKLIYTQHYNLIKVYIYDNDLKCVIPDRYVYDLVKKEDFTQYCELNKSRLYDDQEFIYIEFNL